MIVCWISAVVGKVTVGSVMLGKVILGNDGVLIGLGGKVGKAGNVENMTLEKELMSRPHSNDFFDMFIRTSIYTL